MHARAAVTKLVETVQPTVDFSYHKYLQAHDVVVASEAYNRALETASAIIHKVRWRKESSSARFLSRSAGSRPCTCAASNSHKLERKAAEHALSNEGELLAVHMLCLAAF